jgi:hypothetical protein
MIWPTLGCSVLLCALVAPNVQLDKLVRHRRARAAAWFFINH